MKKVLITGGAGFIGSHVVNELLNKNYMIVIIDNLSTGRMSNLPENKNINYYKLSIEKENIEEIFKTESPDYVIHLAAQTSVEYSTNFTYIDANINIMATIKLLEMCKKYNIKKIIIASSAAVYGNPQYLPIDELHPTRPLSHYGLSKLTMEKYVKLSNLPYVIFRFSNAYGPRQASSRESGVVAIFDNAMKNNKPINIYGDGCQIRDFIYVEDIANICVQSIESNVKNEIINFSTNKGVSLNELFKEMKMLYKYEQDPIYKPKRIGEIKDSVLSNDKISKIFDNITYTNLSDGLNKLRGCNICKIN